MKSIDNRFDLLHRRVLRLVSAWNASTGTWDLQSTTRFTYDGWNVIEEEQLVDSGTGLQPVRTARYTWGTDVSGTLQGAGGVGGLLRADEVVGTNAATTHYYWYDGNSNVTGLMRVNGTIDATYRYTAFGGKAAETYTVGTFGERNRYRFSTKYLDNEVETVEGTYYYGYRHYAAAMGRWLSRDPIGEAGGVDLFVFLSNKASNTHDFLGLLCPGGNPLYDIIAEAGEAALLEAEQDLKNRQNEFKKKPPEQVVGKSPPLKKHEFCGRICEDKNGKLYKTKTATLGREEKCDPTLAPPCNEGCKQVGTYHNHPDNEGLSRSDRLIADVGKPGSTEYTDRNPGKHLPKNQRVPPKLPIGATVRDGNERIRTLIYDPNLSPALRHITCPH